MSYLLNEIIIVLAAAAAIGGLVGWLTRRYMCNRDIETYRTQLDEKQKEIDSIKRDLKTYKSQISSLQVDLVNQFGDLKLMTSRWQTTLKRAKQLPLYQTWLRKIQNKYHTTRSERDHFVALAEHNAAMHTEANEKIRRLNKRVTEQENYKFRLSDMISKVRRLNRHVTTSENQVRDLYGMVTQIQSKWKQDRIDASHLRALHPKLEEQKNQAQWRLAELDKKYTEKFNTQQSDHQSAIKNLQARIDELTPLEGNIPGQDSKFNRFMDKIRLVGTNKNTVLGRTYKQIKEVQLEASEKERVFVDTCEEKDAVIDDLREQLRTVENRAQATAAATVQESKTKISELESKLKTMNQDLALLREHEHTIEAFKHKLKNINNKPRRRVAKTRSTTKPKVEKPAAKPKPAAKLKAPAKGLNIAAAKVKDDLQLIKGIGPKMEQKLNAFGVYSFEQLGKLTSKGIDALTKTLESFPGRIQRDQWVSQSKEQYKKKYGKSIS